MTKRQALLWFLIVSTAMSVGYLVWSGNVENPLPAGTVLIEGERHFREESQYLSIDARYPHVTPMLREIGSKKEGEVIGSFAAFVAATAAQFKENIGLAELDQEFIETIGLGGDRKFTLIIDYEVYESARLMSYVFGIYEDALGAHPNGYYRTFVFDRKTGAQLELADLFVPGSDYLGELSDEAYKQVIAELAERQGEEVADDQADYVRMGTAPTPETLQFFAVDGDQFWIIIPPYQAAAYAAGVFDVKIPLTELSDILRPEYR